MSVSTTNRATARSQIYTALALALTDPPLDLLQALIPAARTGAVVLASPACAGAARSLVRVQSLPRQTLTPAQRLRRATMPPGRRPVALHESLHRDGRLMGPSTLAVERYYRNLGLSVDGAELPDHAGMELAFLSALAEAEAEARTAGNPRLTSRLRSLQRRFLAEHPGNWLPAVGHSLAGSSDALYATLGRWLTEFLGEQMSREVAPNRKDGKAAVRLPALMTVADCTLCGLCTRVCPTHALSIRENRQQTGPVSGGQTRLTLNDGTCVACHRCVDICPENVLVMMAAPPVAVERTLRTSPRLNCPACGHPTVSQAEMTGILARLGDAAASVPNLELCIPCRTADHFS